MTCTTILSSLALTLVLVACGGSATSVPDSSNPAPTGTSPTAPPADTTTPTTPTPTTPTTPTPTPTTPPTPTTCNSILLGGSAIPVTMLAETAPAPVGGALVDGSYDLVSAVLYTGPGGAAGALPVTIKATVALSGTTVNLAQDTSTPSSQRITATIVATGSDLTVTQTCPKPETIAMKYSGGTDLTMFIPNDKGQIVAYTYRR